MIKVVKVLTKAALIWFVIFSVAIMGAWITNLEFPELNPLKWCPDTRMVAYFSMLASLFFGWILQITSDWR